MACFPPLFLSDAPLGNP